MESIEKIKRSMQVNQAFSPSAPMEKFDLFAGRIGIVQDVMNAIGQRGQHVVIFGERGVGKTSLAKVLSDFLNKFGFRRMDSKPINCDATDTFTTIWRKVFREMAFVAPKDMIGLRHNKDPQQLTLNDVWASYATSEEVTPDDVRYVLEQMPETTVIIDEIDRIRDPRVTALMADTIKTLSDHSARTTIILVGVADSIDQLISEHKSVERALNQVHMPRMELTELDEILDKGLGSIGMTIADDAKQRVSLLSRGLPHYTHLLGLHAAQNAINDDRLDVQSQDVREAINKAVEKAQESIRQAYHKAISSQRKDNLYSQVLVACALAQTDDLGFFASPDVRLPMSRIMGKPYEIAQFSQHLNDFAGENRGNILQKIGHSRRFRFRFVDPMMQPFVVINGLSKEIINDAMLAEFTPRSNALTHIMEGLKRD